MEIGKNIVKLLLLFLNILVVGMMIVALIASRVSPEKLLLPAFTTLILPLIIALNLFFVIFWILFKKWFFLISLLILLFSYNTCRVVFPVNFNLNDKPALEKSFTLMTYNTHANDMMLKHTKDRPNRPLQYILDMDPDIVCIQEYSISDDEIHLTEADLKKMFSHYPYQHIQFKVETGWSSFGVATFSKFPIVNKQMIDFESNQNLSIFSDIVVYGDTFRLYNCHLETNKITESDRIMASRLRHELDANKLKDATLHFSKKLGAAYRIRAHQAEQVAVSISKSPHPVIVVGDLNDVPASYTYKLIKGDMKDAFVERGTGLGWTFNESFFLFRIDHIFFDHTFELINFKLDNKVFYSDHFPLRASFKFKNQ